MTAQNMILNPELACRIPTFLHIAVGVNRCCKYTVRYGGPRVIDLHWS